MEERIIDDEYGRGVRLKKTKDGYVDVTDAELDETEGAEEELAFEFPVFETEEDDEELVGLSPEEAAALRQKRAEEAAARQAEYERLCAEGEELLATGSFKSAELKFEKALPLDEEARVASVGYWRAKTSDFAEPDILVEEYLEAGIESLEFDIGYRAVDDIKRDFGKAFEKRLAELAEEEAPLAKTVEGKQAKRREIISERLKTSTVAFACALLPTAVLLALTIVFGLKNFTTRGNEYMMPTIVFGAVFFVCFIVFLLVTNKWINDFRIRKANETLSATEDGERLVRVREMMELYGCLLPRVTEEDEASETEE